MIGSRFGRLRLPSVTQSPSLRVATVAAVLMLASATALGVLFLSGTESLLFFQPSEKPSTVESFIAPTNEHPDAAVLHFVLDTAFVISFTLVFVGLYVLTRERAPEFSAFALGAGIFTGLADAVENGLYWVYAMRATAGEPLTDPALELLSLLTNLKVVGFFTTYLTFALVFPRRDRLERITTLILLLPPTVGLVTLGVREIVDLRPLLFASPSLVLIFVFARGRLAARPVVAPAALENR